MAVDCIGIDIGYGYTKTCRSEKDRQIFPTAVAMMTKEGADEEVIPVVVNGRRYLVGKDAEREGGWYDTRRSSFVASDAWLAVLGHCLWLNDFPDGDVVLGIPPGMYAKGYNRKIVNAIRTSDIRVNGDSCRISGNIRIIPQGAGIFFCHIQNYPDDFRKNVAVIDLGHHTLDMVFFADGKYVESVTETHKIGVSLVLDNIANAFLREHRRSIGFRTALDILRGKQINYMGALCPVDVREEVNGYVHQIDSFVDHYLEKLPAHPDLGVIGGGGAMIKDFAGRHGLLIVSEPAMANAIGYWHYGRNAK